MNRRPKKRRHFSDQSDLWRDRDSLINEREIEEIWTLEGVRSAI